jgi:hypothetical protein
MRLGEVLANGETVPAGKLLDPEVGFWEVMNMWARRLPPSDGLTGSNPP